ncbi:MAG: hypothetical protein DA328_00760 [Nitrososphaeraceae archaeon]|nr:hypothetical protein [Nitrososphaeraceae archaeon]
MKYILSIIGFFVAASIASLAVSFENVFGQFGMSPLPTPSSVLPTYIVDIPAGAWKKDGIHYYPQHIAIPAGTTVAWFNDDPGQPHTVTSGKPGEQGSGQGFNAQIQSTSFAQHTFDRQGLITYYCEYHPWMIGTVYVSESYENGHNFKLSAGTDLLLEDGKYLWNFNKTQHDRVLLSFTPTTITPDESTPVTYKMSIVDVNSTAVFSKNFFGGDNLQVELIQFDSRNGTSVYGPDFTDPVIGAYHVEGNFADGLYGMIIEVTAIGNDILKEPLIDEFQGRIIS